MLINKSIFGAYDIRGIYGKDLTSQIANTLGKAYGSYYLANNINSIVVGRDCRVSSPVLAQSLIDGLLSTGIAVIDLGLATTPMTYFSWHNLNANATIIVSASHSPSEYNGFKSTLNKKPMTEDDYQKVYNLATEGSFVAGKGKLTNYDIWPAYSSHILKDIRLTGKLRIAIDSGNGTAGKFAPELFRKMGCEVFEIFSELDGSFPNHEPYPQKSELYGVLKRTIVEKKADLGLAFDGDADRLGVYSNTGELINSDMLSIIFLRDILSKRSGNKVVMNISTSLSVIDEVKKLGGELVIWKTGYPLISDKMRELNAIFGGEISGHFFFKDRYYGFDDAFYAAARIIEIISNAGKNIAELSADIPGYYSTPEFRLIIPEDKDKFEISKKIAADIKERFPDYEITDIDGTRFSSDEGWGLIRPSNTQPMITGRAEARTEGELEKLKQLIKNILSKYGIILNWEKPMGE